MINDSMNIGTNTVLFRANNLFGAMLILPIVQIDTQQNYGGTVMTCKNSPNFQNM